MNAAVGRERVVDVLLAFTGRCHVPSLRPVVVEVAGSIDRHLYENLRRVDRFGEVGELQPRPGSAPVSRRRDVKLPRARAIEPLAARADAPHERNVDGVRGISRAHGFVRSDRSGDPQVWIRWIRTRRRDKIVRRGIQGAGTYGECGGNTYGVGQEACRCRAVCAPRRDQRWEDGVEEIDRADVDIPALRHRSRVRLVRFHPLSVVEKVESGPDDIIGRPVLAFIGRDVHRYVVEGEVDKIDLVRKRPHDQVAVAAALTSPGRLRGEWSSEGNTERLTQIVGLVEGAVPGLDEALRRRDVDRVPEAWSGIRRALGRGRERVPVNYYRRLAAETFVVDERSGRENVRRRRRGRIPAAASTARLVQQNRGVGYEFDDVCMALSKWERETEHHRHDEDHEQDHKPGITRHFSHPPCRRSSTGFTFARKKRGWA